MQMQAINMHPTPELSRAVRPRTYVQTHRQSTEGIRLGYKNRSNRVNRSEGRERSTFDTQSAESYLYSDSAKRSPLSLRQKKHGHLQNYKIESIATIGEGLARHSPAKQGNKKWPLQRPISRTIHRKHRDGGRKATASRFTYYGYGVEVLQTHGWQFGDQPENEPRRGRPDVSRYQRVALVVKSKKKLKFNFKFISSTVT